MNESKNDFRFCYKANTIARVFNSIKLRRNTVEDGAIGNTKTSTSQWRKYCFIHKSDNWIHTHALVWMHMHDVRLIVDFITKRHYDIMWYFRIHKMSPASRPLSEEGLALFQSHAWTKLDGIPCLLTTPISLSRLAKTERRSEQT